MRYPLGVTNIGNMYGPNFTFLGIPACDLDKPETYADAEVVIVGAPIDSGTSHRSGTKFGPQAIRGGARFVGFPVGFTGELDFAHTAVDFHDFGVCRC